MRIVISIFCLPYEIDELENTLNQLRRASYYIDPNIEWVVDVTLSLSDKMTNWKKSSLPRKYFEEKFLKLSTQVDWAIKYFRTSDEILGCVSQRRNSLLEHSEADFFIWLDTDIIFDEKTLSYFEKGMKSIKKITPYTIITPEIVRIWDNTWDCIVNKEFMQYEVGYQEHNDPYEDCGIKGDINITGVKNNIPNQPRFKFAGGWFTGISAPLLKKIGVPESFGHYGYEDTFIMWASEKLSATTDIDIKQFKIKNLVVCENYKYRNNNHLVSNLSVYDRREEFKKISLSNFNKELEKIK